MYGTLDRVTRVRRSMLFLGVSAVCRRSQKIQNSCLLWNETNAEKHHNSSDQMNKGGGGEEQGVRTSLRRGYDERRLYSVRELRQCGKTTESHESCHQELPLQCLLYHPLLQGLVIIQLALSLISISCLNSPSSVDNPHSRCVGIDQYLIVAPFYEGPLESFFCLLFIRMEYRFTWFSCIWRSCLYVSSTISVSFFFPSFVFSVSKVVQGNPL